MGQRDVEAGVGRGRVAAWSMRPDLRTCQDYLDHKVYRSGYGHRARGEEQGDAGRPKCTSHATSQTPILAPQPSMRHTHLMQLIPGEEGGRWLPSRRLWLHCA